jgi:hypothetical protein
MQTHDLQAMNFDQILALINRLSQENDELSEANEEAER